MKTRALRQAIASGVPGWNLGAIAGALLAFGVVYLNATGRIGWGWLVATTPMVIVGGLCGAFIRARTRHGNSEDRA